MTTREYRNLYIVRKTSGEIPGLPYQKIKEAILGKRYALSVVFPDHEQSVSLHKKWKKKNSPVNVLAFPLDDLEGEVFITLGAARREAHKFDRTYIQHVLALYIHALYHLAGYDHGDEMESLEEKAFAKFSSGQYKM